MPKVPQYDNFQTVPNTLPNARVDAPFSAEAASIPGRQLQEFGKAQTALGNATFAIAQDMQQQADQLRVDDALNKLQEQKLKLTYDKDVGFSNQLGEAALNRASGKPLADEYTDQLRVGADELSQGLATDRQRQLFAARANDLSTQFRGQVLQHETNQFREYAGSVREGTIKNRMNEIGLNYKDPQAVNTALDSINAAVYDMGRFTGKSAEWIEAKARDMTSTAHKTALTSALQNDDVEFAFNYLKQHSKEMNADDILAVNGLLTKDLSARIAYNTASGVIAEIAPRMSTSDAARAFNIALQTESGNRQFDANGKTITSPKGAIGIAQVMPATGPEAAKLAGLEWDEEKFKNDAEYNRKLGEAYFNKQLQDFGGNLAQTYAAYNAGPAATRAAVKEAETKGGEWLSYLPVETQNYVKGNMNAFAAGKGQYAQPTESDVVKAVKARIGDNNPQLLKASIDEALRQYEVTKKSQAATQDAAVANAMQSLIENGGNYAGLDAATRGAIPADKVASVMDFGAKIGKGQEIETDWKLYYDLRKDSSLLGRTNLMAVRDKLADTEFKSLTDQQVAIRQGKLEAYTNVRNAEQILTQYINEALPSDTDKDDKEKITGRIWSEFEQRVRAQEVTLGKKLTQDEQKKIAAQMFTTVDVPKWLGLSSKSKPYALLEEGEDIIIPASDRAQIVGALQATKQEISEKNIRDLYLRGKGAL